MSGRADVFHSGNAICSNTHIDVYELNVIVPVHSLTSSALCVLKVSLLEVVVLTSPS